MHELFIDLLQVSLGVREHLSRTPSTAEWSNLFLDAQKQALVGLLVCGIERLPKEQQPPQEILFLWIGLTVQIEQRNLVTTKACFRLVDKLEKDGYKTCIMKGQANHVYYPKELANRRSCGDIDVWVVPDDEGCNTKDVRRIMNYLEKNYTLTGLCWLHASMNDEEGIPIEVHFRPSFMNEPLRNRRFQKHFKDIVKCSCQKDIDGGQLPAMKVDEDVIYQMNHIYRHLIDEGVGMRQVVDYYFLLRAWNGQHTRTKEETMKFVSWLGMRRFAGALMYVLKEICGMKDEMLLCPASVRDGQFLLSEILIAGNFGQSDPRMGTLTSHSGLRRQLSQASRRFKRNMRFVTTYPGEVFFEPYARMWHFAWKKLKLWRI